MARCAINVQICMLRIYLEGRCFRIVVNVKVLLCYIRQKNGLKIYLDELSSLELWVFLKCEIGQIIISCPLTLEHKQALAILFNESPSMFLYFSGFKSTGLLYAVGNKSFCDKQNLH